MIRMEYFVERFEGKIKDCAEVGLAGIYEDEKMVGRVLAQELLENDILKIVCLIEDEMFEKIMIGNPAGLEIVNNEV